MVSYIWPTYARGPVDQDGSWQGHKNRKPPSVNPGVDFGVAYGSAVNAAAAGRVELTDNVPDGSGGRMVYIRHSDGSQTQYLHLSEILVSVGQQVAQGQLIAKSGASGFGSNYGYAPHCHVSLYIGGVNVDFMQHVANISSAGGGGTLINNARSKRMYLQWTTDGSGWLVTEDGWLGLGSPQVYNLFYRVINSDQTKSPFTNGARPDTFLRAEVDIMNAQQRLLRTANAVGTTIDPQKLASALTDAIGKSITATLPPELIQKLDAIERGVEGITLTPEDFHVEASVSPEELAQAFDAAVPRVAAAITRAAGTAMAGVKG